MHIEPRSFSSFQYFLTTRRYKRRQGITINHGQGKSKARRRMERNSRRINRCK